MPSAIKRRIFGFALCAGFIAGAVNVSAASPFAHGAQSFSPVPWALQISSRERGRKLDGVYHCCWRKLRGQPLIGLYCGQTILNYALANDIVRIVTSNGNNVCTYGAHTRRLR